MYFSFIKLSNIYPLLILIMFFFSFYIFKQNKLLKSKLNKLENENKDKNNHIEKNKDTISIDKISSEQVENKEIKEEVKKITNKVNKQEKKYYSKNVLNNKRAGTSPISISSNNKFNPDEYIMKGNNKKFNLEELSKKLDASIEPKTIELTEYEKKQEENAVISYKELLKIKDEIYPLDDEEDTKYFIEELKKFRNSLN